MNVHCPYCNSEVEINHDDGYGYEEDEMYHQECCICEKTFVYHTHITIHHYPEKADCLNGGKHTFYKTKTFPPEFAIMRCSTCGEEKPVEKV